MMATYITAQRLLLHLNIHVLIESTGAMLSQFRSLTVAKKSSVAEAKDI